MKKIRILSLFLALLLTALSVTGCSDKAVNTNTETSASVSIEGTAQESETPEADTESKTTVVSAVIDDESEKEEVSSEAESSEKSDEITVSTAPESNASSSSTSTPVPTITPTPTPTPVPTVTATPTPTPTATPSSSSTVTSVTYINGILIANKTYALPADYAPGDLLPEVYSAFYKLQAAAKADGLNIYISSGYRSYNTQKSLYERYCARDGQAAADRYSARPGHSEHQTGLAMDVNEISDAFIGTPEAIWLAEHAHEYGFIIRYPQDKEGVTGYKYEPWHLRYLGVSTATDVYLSGLCLEEYLGITSVYAD